MTFAYKHILMIGATSGIGKAMADRLVTAGIKVTAVGRRKDRLDEFVRAHGESRAGAVAFDISDVDNAPQFAADAMKTSPDIDCVFLNAGVQRSWDFSSPETVDLKEYNKEVDVNYTSFVALTQAFLPFLISKSSPTSLIYTGTHLGIVPALMLPGYSASKAALCSFILTLREQLASKNIKVIEIMPPPVQTELHDHMGEEEGRKLGMPVGAFTEQAFEGLMSGSDEIIIGGPAPREVFNEVVAKRRMLFNNLTKLLRSTH